EFTDLNKRNAGTVAPSSKGVYSRPNINVSIIEDVDLDEPSGRLTLPVVTKNDEGKWSTSEEENDLTDKTNRTDAQGYVTENFSRDIQAAYGAMAGYEKIYKPVLFGVT